MPQEKSLVIDCTWDDAFRLPREPLLSSALAGWHGIHLEYHRQPPFESPEHRDTMHDIHIHHFKQPQRIQWTVNGRCQQEQCIANGEIAIMPANVLHGLSWDLEIESTTLSLEPEVVTRIAYESVDPDAIEIVPTFAKPDPLICQIGIALKSVLETDGAHSRLYAESAATMLAAHLLQHYCARKHTIQEYVGGLPNYKLRQAIAYINEHLDRNLSLAAIATEVGMSQYHFSRLFKQSMGVSVHQYAIQRRVECAKQLLLRGELSITEVAFQVGFANPSHLSHHFKRIVGITPKMFFNKSQESVCASKNL